MKFDIKESQQRHAFHYSLYYGYFKFGYNDIYIDKSFNQSSIYQNDDSSFDYKGIENALIGKTEECNGHFSPNRIWIIKMNQKKN